MKFLLLSLIATAQATGDWEKCTKQDCSTSGWICCLVMKPDESAYGTDMICTDPDIRGIVPTSVNVYGGGSYHCTHQQHVDYLDT